MPPKFRRKLTKILAKIKIPLLLFGIIFLIGLAIFFRPKTKPSFWWSVLFTNPLKQTFGLTNVLLLGVSGGTHEGADLTDTMIFLGFNQKSGRTVLISLPRDLWSPTLLAKINSAYHYGEGKKPGGGLILAKSIVEEIVGLPIHYAVKIDFTGFVKLIDLLGGVEIEIERTFDDYKFPIEGKENDPCGGDPEYKCRYQHVRFDAGKQLLNGEKALQYVRSRNAQGEEGTDFARSRRQQKLILALKNRIFSSRILLKPRIALQFVKVLPEVIETDIGEKELPYFARIALRIKSEKINTLVLDPFLINPPVWQYGQWVLVPRTEDFTEIQEYIKGQILTPEEEFPQR
ncbi:MAG: cell envelope-related transcriptional attenuator [Microgenomates group bacterium LiPW_16]|nr:MAG: cell envelope-related transcriptional attenuator [Microgenomates group bacterium LiPW_16]